VFSHDRVCGDRPLESLIGGIAHFWDEEIGRDVRVPAIEQPAGGSTGSTIAKLNDTAAISFRSRSCCSSNHRTYNCIQVLDLLL
jgi:hypothetical protein